MENLRKVLHCFYCYINRKRLKNTNFTIISSNCIGGVIYSDLKLEFLSPTINLFMKPKDFIKLCNNLESYMNYDLEEIFHSPVDYPVAKLHDITLYLMHYKSFQEAELAWNRRKNRINYRNIFVIMTDRDGFTDEDLKEYRKIKYKKILFTNHPTTEKDLFYIKGFENENQVGDTIKYDNNSIFKRYFEQFDLVKFFNR